jgi:hypothetical protein
MKSERLSRFVWSGRFAKGFAEAGIGKLIAIFTISILGVVEPL